MSQFISILPFVLRALGVDTDKNSEAAETVKRAVIQEIAAAAQLTTRFAWENEKPTDKVRGLELDIPVENWVISFGASGGPGSLKFKDPEFAARLQAEREAKRQQSGDKPAKEERKAK